MNSLFRIVICALLTFSLGTLKAMQNTTQKENLAENSTHLNTPVMKRVAYISTVRAFDYDRGLRAQEFKAQTERMKNGSCKDDLLAHAKKKEEASLHCTESLPIMTADNMRQKGRLTAEVKTIGITTSWEKLTEEQQVKAPAINQVQNPVTVSVE